MSADYSQIELRLAAHMADVPQLKEAFATGDDIHNMTAEELFGTVDRDTRGKAKTVNFAILYGISAWGLAGRLGVPREEGKAIIDRYFERFPGIRAYIDDTLPSFASMASRRPCSGGRRISPNIRSPNPSDPRRAPSGRRSTRRSRAPAPTSSSGRWPDGRCARGGRARRRQDAAAGP